MSEWARVVSVTILHRSTSEEGSLKKDTNPEDFLLLGRRIFIRGILNCYCTDLRRKIFYMYKNDGCFITSFSQNHKKIHVYIWYIHLFIFSTRKIYVIAASFLTLQFEYFKVDRLGCLLDLWCGRLMNISTDIIKHDFSKTQNQVHF